MLVLIRSVRKGGCQKQIIITRASRMNWLTVSTGLTMPGCSNSLSFLGDEKLTCLVLVLIA